MVNLGNQILCITHNYAYKEHLRNFLASNNNISILFIHNISDAVAKLQSQHFILVIVDEILSTEDSQAFYQLLSLITSLCINMHTLIIVPKLADEYFAKYIKQGFTYITDMNTAQHMLPAVLKSIGEFRSQRPPSQKISYKGLTIDSESNLIFLRGCQITLRPTQTLILLFLVRHRGYCEIYTIQRYLKSMLKKPISQSYVTVNMFRLSKRIKDVTGLEIVRNRYGVGYYLVL